MPELLIATILATTWVLDVEVLTTHNRPAQYTEYAFNYKLSRSENNYLIDYAGTVTYFNSTELWYNGSWRFCSSSKTITGTVHDVHGKLKEKPALPHSVLYTKQEIQDLENGHTLLKSDNPFDTTFAYKGSLDDALNKLKSLTVDTPYFKSDAIFLLNQFY